MKQTWNVEGTSYRIPRDHKPIALVYDPTPGGRKNEDGTTTHSLRFPALILTDIVSDQENVAKKLAAELNAFPDMLDALKKVNGIIAEAAMTGFNYADGDWAERLFQSQQTTIAAIKKATAPVSSQELPRE